MPIDTPARIPMAWSAQTLARVCDEIDDAVTIDAALDQAFTDASVDLGEAVDRRIAFDRWIKIQVAAQEEGYRYYRARKELLEQVHSRFKEKTKAIIEASPGLEEAFRGKLGKISLCASPPAVEYSFGTKEITPEAAVMFGVPQEYLVTKVSYAVDSARVKGELQSGQTLDWASLRTGFHIRFPAAPKKKEIEA